MSERAVLSIGSVFGVVVPIGAMLFRFEWSLLGTEVVPITLVPMEISAWQYRADAERCRKLAEQTNNPVRRILYNRMERSYLTLAEAQEALDRSSASDRPL